MKRLLFTLLLSSLSLAACEKSSSPGTETSGTPAPGNSASTMPSVNTAADNSGMNVRDRNLDTKTADGAGQGKSDVQITAQIRRQVMDANLSVNAQNAKIVVQNGKVTLRGPVKSQEEKDKIGAAAEATAGTGNVDNQLDIQP